MTSKQARIERRTRPDPEVVYGLTNWCLLTLGRTTEVTQRTVARAASLMRPSPLDRVASAMHDAEYPLP